MKISHFELNIEDYSYRRGDRKHLNIPLKKYFCQWVMTVLTLLIPSVMM